jgi:arylsulfatase A-like enzyme
VKQWRERVAWVVLTLPLAALCALVYSSSEWLFMVTRPSPLAALPLATRLAVLGRGPLPTLLPLLGAQLVATIVSLVAYPRTRALAVVPAAAIGGALLLTLVDNFTYTLFGFGVLTSDGVLRVAYAAVVPALVVVAGARLYRWVSACDESRAALISAAALSIVLGVSAFALTHEPVREDVAPPTSALGAGAGSRPNVLILGIDGVDASSLSAYGYARDTSPYLTKLAAESLFFENAFSNVGRTHGSLVALLTGRLPFSSHVTFPPTVLQGEDAHRHLPALLKPRGYTSLQLGMRHYADAEDANLLGFDATNYRWQDLEHLPSDSEENEPAVFRSAVAERIDERVGHLFGLHHAIDAYAHIEGREESPYWKDERRVATLMRYLPTASEPWFVHAHFLDTHCCSYHPRVLSFSGTDLQHDALDSQLREADDNVRDVIESLRTSGRLERTIVVVMSDHTNGWTTKGRVPLLIRFPGGTVTGRVQANVQLADVAPTLMDYLGEPIPGWMDGVSLLNLAQREGSRPIFGISEIRGRHSTGFRITELDDAGPPNYGAGTVTMISGATWFELSLEDGALSSGPVKGHTRPDTPSLEEPAARALILRQLSAAGFRIGDAER